LASSHPGEGIDFGAHSCTHPDLTKINPEKAEEEMRRSRDILEERLGQPIRFFCYPYGRYNLQHRDIVARVGYVAACTVRPGVNRPGMDLYQLRRTEITSKDRTWGFKKAEWGI